MPKNFVFQNPITKYERKEVFQTKDVFQMKPFGSQKSYRSQPALLN
jgi:hypothetical protein